MDFEEAAWRGRPGRPVRPAWRGDDSGDVVRLGIAVRLERGREKMLSPGVCWGEGAGLSRRAAVANWTCSRLAISLSVRPGSLIYATLFPVVSPAHPAGRVGGELGEEHSSGCVGGETKTEWFVRAIGWLPYNKDFFLEPRMWFAQTAQRNVSLSRQKSKRVCFFFSPF